MAWGIGRILAPRRGGRRSYGRRGYARGGRSAAAANRRGFIAGLRAASRRRSYRRRFY